MKKNGIRVLVALLVLLTMGLVLGVAGADTENVSYINENGETSSHDATVLTGGGATTLDPGWYVVNSDITYTDTLDFNPGDVHIILVDGCTMNIGKSGNYTSRYGINNTGTDKGSTTIYGQSGGSGKINIYSYYDGICTREYTQYGGQIYIYSSSDSGFLVTTFTFYGGSLDLSSCDPAVHAWEINMYGGTLMATCRSDDYCLKASSGDINILGGHCEARNNNVSGKHGVYSLQKNITLGWTNENDSIYASKYITNTNGGVIQIAKGKALKDESGNIYYGVLTAEQISAIAGKTLTPAHMHVFTYSANEATITATCNSTVLDCDLTGDPTLTIVKPAKTTYDDANSEAATLTGTDAFNAATAMTGVTVSENDIQYFAATNSGKTGNALTAAPDSAGDYVAEITVGGAVASVGYTINPKTVSAPTITVTGGPYTYTGSQINATVEVYDGNTLIDPKEYTISYTDNTDAGTNAVISITDKDGGNYIVSGSTTFTINPAGVTLTANSRGTDVYDGTEKTVTGFTCSKEGLTFTGVSAGGSGTNAGEYDVEFSGVTVNETKDSTGNYVVTDTINGKLTINPAPVTLTANSGIETYDGKAKTVTGFTASEDGLTFADTVTAGGSGTEAGEYDVVFSGVMVNDTKDNTRNYVVAETKNGKLKIGKTTGLTASLEGSAYTYDGTAKAIGNNPTTNAPTGITAYSYSFDGNEYVSDLSSLTKTDAGSYTVYVKATNPNYSDEAKTTATLAIAKAANPLTVTPAASVKIGGNTVDLTANVSKAEGAVTYAITGALDGCSINADTGVLTSGSKTGTCTVTVVAAGNGNYIAGTKTITVTVTEKDTQALSFAEKKVTKTWGDVPFINALSGAKTRVTYAVTAGTDVAAIDAATGSVTILKVGTTTITATAEETQDVTGATASYTLTVNKADPTVTAPTAKEDLIANGSTQELIVAGTAVGGEMQYALGADATTAPAAGWNTAIPTGTEAGTYYAWYKVVGDEYHNDTVPICVTVTIAEAPQKTDIGKAKISPEDQEYTGKEIKPKLTVKLNGKKLKEKKDYTAAFKFNKDIGKATVTITGTGDYTGTATGSFLIIPKKVGSPKLTAEKGKKDALTLSWKAGKGIDGYEIEYGLKKDFKGAKKITLKGAKNDEYEITKLTAKKTYYVRIRAWKKAKGKMYYSAWSKTLSKKVK